MFFQEHNVHKVFELRLNPLVCASLAVNLPRSQSSQATVHRQTHISLLSTGHTHPTSESQEEAGSQRCFLSPVGLLRQTPGGIEGLYLYKNQRFAFCEFAVLFLPKAHSSEVLGELVKSVDSERMKS